MSIGIKFQLRLPADLKTWLEEDACRNDRSMNGQVIAVLRERMNKQLESQESRVGASKPD
ncbi:Arc family DNA-binding protein [Massilia sp. CCM 8733]|uniref:Arc family DNA-binding protein n=1 Tax=Massilia mucilaginosa TaxID=2609282 RepID=A0ABX0NP41_9BURK|nr:Arc family DNA-binding protein [Massilia mucilaginosa]